MIRGVRKKTLPRARAKTVIPKTVTPVLQPPVDHKIKLPDDLASLDRYLPDISPVLKKQSVLQGMPYDAPARASLPD